MLKSQQGDWIWLVQQPDHARVAGYFAAHWGGNSQFVRPGSFAKSTDADRLRDEVIIGIAEHDNGWWEWEAFPPMDTDGLPLNLPDVARTRPEDGLQRWRIGIPRLAVNHPYGALLTSYHAYWLYGFAFDEFEHDPAHRHPLFGSPEQMRPFITNAEPTRKFVHEMVQFQREIKTKLQADPFYRQAIEPDSLQPHVRLLQILDSLSLVLSYGGTRSLEIRDVPTQNWRERTTIQWTPGPDRSVIVDPYPFDLDPLEVMIPLRMIHIDERQPTPHAMTRFHSLPLQMMQFRLQSR